MQILTVTEITSMLKSCIEIPELSGVLVQGEIVEYKKNPSSGHIYFSLADPKIKDRNQRSLIRCTFFRNYQMGLNFSPKMGIEVIVTGDISLYPPMGQYNLKARKLEKVGTGELLKKIEELRNKLSEEGLTKLDRKKPLPKIPLTLGIVTGMGTAAFRDMIKQIYDRYPNINLVLAPAVVQGQDAPNSILAAIKEIQNPCWEVDVIIVGRGGGSPEDLMAFNDESVCRAIASARIPIISGVGHQIDHPISDDVADKIAATPTDAAKIALPEIGEWLRYLDQLEIRLDQNIKAKFEAWCRRLMRVQQSRIFTDPMSMLETLAIQLDYLVVRMQKGLRTAIDQSQTHFLSISNLSQVYKSFIDEKITRYSKVITQLEAYSPLATINRGYSIVQNKRKDLISSVTLLSLGDDLEVRFSDGKIISEVKEILPFKSEV